MAIDVLAKVKLDTGEYGRVGDVGKTAIRKLEPDMTEDQIEYNFLYAFDLENSSPDPITVRTEDKTEKASEEIKLFSLEDLF